MITIKVFDWPSEMRFRRASVGYAHPSVAGTKDSTGRPQASTLAIPKRLMVDAAGPQKDSGVVEVVRYALQPANLVRMPSPYWCKGRSKSVAALARGVVWDDGAEWADGAEWGPYLYLDAASEGDTSVTVNGLPPNEKVFRSGDAIGINGAHYMVRLESGSDENGAATVSLVRGLQSAVAAEDQAEFPVRHLFLPVIPMPTDRDFGIVYDWEATMVEVFKSEYPGVTFEDATFFG